MNPITATPLRFLFLLIAITVPVLLQAATYRTIYVKPDGNDANDGSTWVLAKKTIPAAQSAVRNVIPNMGGDIEVVLGEGTYFTNGSPFTFTEQDSGLYGWRVIWRNDPGKKVILSAGKKIVDTWTLSGGNIYYSDHYYNFEIRQLYVNGEREYFAHTNVVENDAAPDVSGKYIDISTVNMPTYSPAHPIEFVLFTHWATKVSRFTAAPSPVPGKTRLTPTPGHYFDNYWEFSSTSKHAYFFQRSSFFSINHGFYHRPTERIWYSKPTTVDLSTAEIIVPMDQEVVRIAGTGTTTARAHDIVFSGLGFEHSTWTSPSVAANGFIGNQAGEYVDGADVDKFIPGGVVVLNAYEIDFERCTFKNMGGSGLEFRGYADRCRVDGCHFTDISGIALLMAPLDYANYVTNCYVVSNLIENCGVEYYDCPGIVMKYGQFNSFIHNEVKDLPYTGISIGWGWGKHYDAPIQDNWCNFNHVHNVMELLRDGAGIYVLEDQNDGLGGLNWMKISQNYIHDILLNPLLTPGAGAFGVYIDQGGNHIRVESNAIANITSGEIYDHSVLGQIEPVRPQELQLVNNNVSVGHVAANAGPIPGYDVYTPPSAYVADRDIAPLCRVYSSSNYASANWADCAVDQRANTLWASAGGDAAPKFTVDFLRSQRVTRIELVARQDAVVNDNPRRNFRVLGWTGPKGTGIATELARRESTPFPAQGTWSAIPSSIGPFQSVTIEKTDSGHFNFSALRVYSDN